MCCEEESSFKYGHWGQSRLRYGFHLKRLRERNQKVWAATCQLNNYKSSWSWGLIFWYFRMTSSPVLGVKHPMPKMKTDKMSFSFYVKLCLTLTYQRWGIWCHSSSSPAAAKITASFYLHVNRLHWANKAQSLDSIRRWNCRAAHCSIRIHTLYDIKLVVSSSTNYLKLVDFKY